MGKERKGEYYEGTRSPVLSREQFAGIFIQALSANISSMASDLPLFGRRRIVSLPRLEGASLPTLHFSRNFSLVTVACSAVNNTNIVILSS